MSCNIKPIKDDKYNNIFRLGYNILNNVLPATNSSVSNIKCTNGGEELPYNKEFINANDDILLLVKESSKILLQNDFNIDQHYWASFAIITPLKQ